MKDYSSLPDFKNIAHILKYFNTLSANFKIRMEESGDITYLGQKKGSRKPLKKIEVVDLLLSQHPEIGKSMDKANLYVELWARLLLKDIVDEEEPIVPELSEQVLKLYEGILKDVSQDGVTLYSQIAPGSKEVEYVGEQRAGSTSPLENHLLYRKPVQLAVDPTAFTPWEMIEMQMWYGKKIMIPQTKKIIRATTDMFLEQYCPSHSVKLITNDPNEYSFCYFDRAHLRTCEGSCKPWEDAETYMHPEMVQVFRAWLYSIIVATNGSRQALWLYDKGHTFKTQFTRALMTRLGERITLSSTEERINSPFFWGDVYGKRVVIFPDNSNSKLVMKKEIHKLCSGEAVPMEQKYEKTRTTHMYTKVIVTSNFAPEISELAVSDRTRIIPIKLTPNYKLPHWDLSGSKPRNMGNPDAYKQQLVDTIDNYLNRCEESYKALCPGDSQIVPTSAQEALMESYLRYSTDATRHLLQTSYVFTKDENDTLSFEKLCENLDIGEDSHWKRRDGEDLLEMFGCRIEKTTINGVQVRLIHGIKPRLRSMKMETTV